MLMNEHEHSTICRNVNVLRRRLRSFKITDKLRIVIAFCIVNLNQFIYLSMSQNCMVVVMEIGVEHFYVKNMVIFLKQAFFVRWVQKHVYNRRRFVLLFQVYFRRFVAKAYNSNCQNSPYAKIYTQYRSQKSQSEPSMLDVTDLFELNK